MKFPATDSFSNEPSKSFPWVYYASFIGLGLLMMTVGATLTELARRTHAPFDEISYSFLARSLGFCLGALFGGRIYDRVAEGHRVLGGALAVMAACSALVPFMTRLEPLIGLFLLQGLAGSLINVGANTLLVWAARRNIGAFLIGLHFSWGLGSALSPLLIEQIENLTGSITWAYLAITLVIFPVCFWLWRVPSPSQPEPTAAAPGEVKLLLACFVAIFFFFYTGLEASMINWIHTYTMHTGLGDKSAAYKLNSSFLLVFTFGRLLAIPIATKFRPRTILIADFIGGLVSTGVILWWPSSARVLWAASWMLGLSLASIFPTMLAFAERRMPLSGRLTGYLFSASSCGSMMLPFLIGQFFIARGPQILFDTILVSLGIDVIIFSVMMVLYPAQKK